MRMHFISTGLENCDVITKHTNCNFIFLIQRSMLWGLKEAGHLNEMQYRQAEATLLEQHRENIRAHAVPLKDD